MVIEWLKVKIAPELREKFIQLDTAIWTPFLANFPGFLGKEVWINPEQSEELVLVIRWATLEHWQAVPAEPLQQTEQRFDQELGGSYEMIEENRYQVRKFPQ